MIVDRLENAHLYLALSPRIKRAFEYLQQTDLAAIEPGNYEIDGKNMYVRVQQYTSKPADQGKWESHRRYIDLQYIVQGQECIIYAPLSSLTQGEYDEKKDFWHQSGEGSRVNLPAGSFMLLWPFDGHMPNLAVDTPGPVKKVVVKIAVD